jgi:hypothetical protein
MTTPIKGYHQSGVNVQSTHSSETAAAEDGSEFTNSLMRTRGGDGHSASTSSSHPASPQRDRFRVASYAAHHALNEANPQSISENREYGGYIYKTGPQSYGYTRPVAGSIDGFNPADAQHLIPPGAKTVGDYHTHGNHTYDDGTHHIVGDPQHDSYDSNHFSDSDFDGIHHDALQRGPIPHSVPGFSNGNDRYRGYLATPTAGFRVHDPLGNVHPGESRPTAAGNEFPGNDRPLPPPVSRYRP